MRYLPPVFSAIPLRVFAEAAAHAGSRRALPDAVARLEAEYPDRRCTLTSSGTAALELVLKATKPEGGGLVALPAYACPDLATAAIGAGFRIVLYDLNCQTLAPELASVEHCLAAGATHIVVAHWYGQIIDPAPVAALAKASGAMVIEDAAQHAGGRLRGVRAGALSDWAILSFGRGKGLNAGGGGAVLAGSAVADALLRLPQLPALSAMVSLRVLGGSVATAVVAHPQVYGTIQGIPALAVGATRFTPPHPVSAMSPISATLVRAALDAEPATLARRRCMDQEYLSAFAAIDDVESILEAPDTISGSLRHPFLVSDHVLPSMDSLHRLGVVRGYPKLLTDYPEIQPALVQQHEEFPGANRLAKYLFTAPTHRFVRKTDIVHIAHYLRGLHAP